MIKIGTYNFPEQISQTTVDDISFTITSDLIPVSITGVRFEFSNGVNLISPTNVTITNGPNGQFVIPSFLMTWGKGYYKYKMFLTLTGGAIKQYAEGSWRIL